MKYRVSYVMADGTVETHEVEATDPDTAVDTAQPDHPGEAEIERIEVEEVA